MLPMRTSTLCLLVALTACSAEADRATPSAESTCPGSGPTDAAIATVTASAESTACLVARCTPIAACGQVTAAQPVCVEVHSAGGMLLDFYACPPDGCCY